MTDKAIRQIAELFDKCGTGVLPFRGFPVEDLEQYRRRPTIYVNGKKLTEAVAACEYFDEIPPVIHPIHLSADTGFRVYRLERKGFQKPSRTAEDAV